MTPTAQRRVLHGELVNNVGFDFLKGGVGNHLQPGVVTYDNDDGTKTTYLLDLDAIARMRRTAPGKPIVGKKGDFDHMKVKPGEQYDGQAASSFWAGDIGWERIQFMLTNKETAEACEKGYQFSCAYIPTETDGTPGLWHNVPYDEKILDGEYTHFAVVPNPRYDGAKIELFNSTGGGVMNKVLKAALALVPFAQLKEVYNSIEDEEKKKEADAKAAKENMQAERRAAAQTAYDSAMKNASSDEDRAKAKEAFEKANAEAMNPEVQAEPKADLPKEPLGGGNVAPEPGVPGQDPIKKDEPKAVANAETPMEAQEREKKAAEAAALEKTNADKAAADKEAEEKKNAEDAKAKEEKEAEEKKNSLAIKAKAEADAKAEALRTERFNSLRTLAEERGGSSGTPFVGVVSVQEKEDLGRERYGSRQ